MKWKWQRDSSFVFISLIYNIFYERPPSFLYHNALRHFSCLALWNLNASFSWQKHRKKFRFQNFARKLLWNYLTEVFYISIRSADKVSDQRARDPISWHALRHFRDTLTTFCQRGRPGANANRSGADRSRADRPGADRRGSVVVRRERETREMVKVEESSIRKISKNLIFDRQNRGGTIAKFQKVQRFPLFLGGKLSQNFEKWPLSDASSWTGRWRVKAGFRALNVGDLRSRSQNVERCCLPAIFQFSFFNR